MTHQKTATIFGVVLFVAFGSSGCLPYIYHDRSVVLLDGIDIDQTLDIAEGEMEEGGFGSVLTVWCLRDQPVTPEQAARISGLYFGSIDTLAADDGGSFFDTWHLTWAISNLYRLGNQPVRAALEEAYRDSERRVEHMDSDVATLYFGGDDQIHMGDAHAFGQAFARSRLVVPGNPMYLQSASDLD